MAGEHSPGQEVGPVRRPGTGRSFWSRVLRRVLAPLVRDLDTQVDGVRSELQTLREQQQSTREEALQAGAGLHGVREEVRDLRSGFLATREEFEEVRDRRVPRIQSDLSGMQAALELLQGEAEYLRQADPAALRQAMAEVQGAMTDHLAAVERLHGHLGALQREVEVLRDQRLARNEQDLAAVHRSLQGVLEVAEELRDGRVPALAAAWEATTCRLHEEVEAARGLLDRLMLREPLGVVVHDEGSGEEFSEALREASAALAEAFRGPRSEIPVEMDEVADLVEGHPPVADLGCGRGELLQLLQDRGVAARGVDSDAAMVAACGQRGLSAFHGDARKWLQEQEEGSLGAVVAAHLLEHLPVTDWISVLVEASRCLSPGGVMVVTCPNPDALRVGGGLFWSDPTRHRPIHPQGISLMLGALGFQVEPPRYRRPFSAQEMLAEPGQTPEVRALAERLDQVLFAPRDFVLVARKPGAAPA